LAISLLRERASVFDGEGALPGLPIGMCERVGGGGGAASETAAGAGAREAAEGFTIDTPVTAPTLEEVVVNCTAARLDSGGAGAAGTLGGLDSADTGLGVAEVPTSAPIETA
jgi:hypothetical protein